MGRTMQHDGMPGMDAMQSMDMMGGGGTFFGHWAPGAVFLTLAVIWLVQDLRRPPVTDPPAQDGWIVPLYKLAFAVIGLVVEMPNRGWYPMDWMMAWQHMTIYAVFAGSAVVDILWMRGRATARATHFAISLGLFAGALVFLGHHNHDGMSAAAHRLLAVAFTMSAAAALVEGLAPSRGIRRVRQVGVAVVGSWLIVIAWVLFRSGWDPASSLSEGWVWTLFAWTWIGVAAFFAVLEISVGAAGRADPD